MSDYELFNIDCIELGEIIDKAKVALRFKNKEYKNLLDDVADLKENHPNLQLLFEEDDDISLSKNDCRMLQKLINLELEIRNFEEQEIFFLRWQGSILLFQKHWHIERVIESF